ncbi:unnamed protein product [Microthlaspi erraticum]|uniref:F-box domain-containing protein n=1 Tax=Microthlaspi erraticum TaxID=1685480 RepID=A0A6D2I9L8_9BRAS|nr:unnamed protein product [Microthlaspi erraticum]
MTTTVMDSIPTDLFLDIFSRLPVKSVAKCLFVSKQWASIICRPDFTELFLTRSNTRPRLLFAVKELSISEWHFFSLPQPQNPYEKSSLVVFHDSHIKFPKGMRLDFCGHASGLIYFHGTSERVEDTMHVMHNPSTGQYEFSPELRKGRDSQCYLGFDPIDNIIKVLSLSTRPYCDEGDEQRILTLGTGETSWRKIQCPLHHWPSRNEGICINGVLYYPARLDDTSSVVVCFDVRTEKFKFIATSVLCDDDKLINFKGKLCRVDCYGITSSDGSRSFVMCMSVLEDVEKEEWSEYTYWLEDDELVRHCIHVSVDGVTATGDIVLSMGSYTSRPFCVFYFSPESNTLQRVEIQGFGGMFNIHTHRVEVIVDHIEDLKFNII